jgi:hypothetical protein
MPHSLNFSNPSDYLKFKFYSKSNEYNFFSLRNRIESTKFTCFIDFMTLCVPYSNKYARKINTNCM